MSSCELLFNDVINEEIFRMIFVWKGEAPKAGQFFMIKPQRSVVFLGRPISVAHWKPGTLTFLIAKRGRGTLELAAMRSGEEAELIGPLGNAWEDFLPEKKDKPIALVGGGIGIAPLYALLNDNPGHSFDLYAGFKKGFKNDDEQNAMLGSVIHKVNNCIIASENGKTGHKGRIPDFLEPEKYAAVCACGPEPMLNAVAKKCTDAGVLCFVSLERRMACGVGACLGCTVKTVNGNHGFQNRRCCADGPIFNAEEVLFDE